MIAGVSISLEILVIGALTGLGYAVLGAGLVLIHRSTGVINFAHGEMGAFGAAMLAKLVLDYHWDFFAALGVVVAVGAAIGAVIELGIVRRLFDAPRLIVLVATIGIAQLLFFAQTLLPEMEAVAAYPAGIDRSMNVGMFVLRGEHFMLVAVVPALIVGLAILLNRTPYGVAIRASSDNADAARLAGISPRRTSTLVWVLAAVLATITVVLLNPIRGVIVGQTFSAALGPGLLLRALVAALSGRLVSLPRTVVGGVALGVAEAVVHLNVADPGAVDLLLLLVVLGLVFAQRRAPVGRAEAGSWSLAATVRPVPERLRELWWVRHLGHLGAGAALLLGLALPLVFTSSSQVFLFSRVALFAMIALSLTVLTGWAGLLSLGQFAFVGVGSLGAAALVARGMPFGVAVLYATVAGVLVALVVGVPALRVRGLHLAIATLAFASAAQGWLFTRGFFLGDQPLVTLDAGTLWVLDLRSQRTYYYVCLCALVAVAWMVARLRGSGIGRALVAIRNNQAAASAYTVSPAAAKLAAFAVSGGIAAFAGALLGGLRVHFGPDVFSLDESLRVVAMAVIGGVGSVAGSVLGAVYVLGLPALIQDTVAVRLLTSGIGLLILVLYFPGGIAQILYRARDGLLGVADRRLAPGAGAPPPARTTPVAVALASPAPGPRRVAAAGASPLALVAADVTVAFGGLIAVDGATIVAAPGEVIGLIGSNGAGKSTLLDAISGFVPLRAGRVELFGADVAPWPPHLRAAAGLGRVFQDAGLFRDLTVQEALELALEAHEPSELVPSLLGLPPSVRSERRKRAESGEIVSYLGLGRYADSFVGDLSTGTRRIVELGCLLALRPRVLLLDEPTAGVAQRETEAFGPLILQVRQDLDATMVVVEHDMPFIMSLSDRVYCLAAGAVIAEGPPAHVRDDPAVIAAYLGTDERAVRRSDFAPVGVP